MNFRKIFQNFRIYKFQLLSNCKNVIGKPKISQPVQFAGEGKIIFGSNVTLGYFPSPYYYNGYIYIESRNKESKIIFGDDIIVNNGCVFISEGKGIEIGSQTLIGTNCEIIDSDFHNLEPHNRHSNKANSAKVKIGKNVFIGNNVRILKGVHIGDNSVIANGSIVTKNIQNNVIVGGNPAKLIKKIQNEFK